MKALTIGVLGQQGDVEEHISATNLALRQMDLKGEVIWAKTMKDIERVDGLIIPGGESTVVGRLADYNGTLQEIKNRISKGMPVLGTCTGLIMLAKEVHDRFVSDVKQPILGIMDVIVERNAFGRQIDSFEADLEIPAIGKEKFKGVFIRAPVIQKAGSGVKVLCKLNEIVVAAQQNNIIGVSFHPELTNDTRVHRFFLENVRTLVS